MCHDLHFDLIQTPATRQQGFDNPSALDVFLTDSPQFFSKPSTIPSSSDHLIVGIQLNIKVSPSPQLLRTGRNYAKYSKAKMLEVLDIPLFNVLLYENDTNKVANEIVSLINKGLDIIAPIKTTQTRYKYAPYLSVETKEQMSLRDLAFSQYKDNPNEETKIEYKRLRNKVVSSQKAEKKAWTKSILV